MERLSAKARYVTDIRAYAPDITVVADKCDFVLPIDADEFWYSETCPSVRDSLELLPKERSMLVTVAYDFFLTERDEQLNSSCNM
ncbi:hypothetical protein [Desulfonatronum parangueonense]